MHKLVILIEKMHTPAFSLFKSYEHLLMAFIV